MECLMEKWYECLHTSSIYWWSLFASQRTAKSQNNRHRSTENLIVIHEMPLRVGRVSLWCAISATSLGSYFSGTIYSVSQEECARLRKGVPYVKVYRFNPKHLCPKLNGYGDKGARKVWSSCGSTYCTWFAWRNTHTLRIVRHCLQPAQARSLLRLHM